MLPKAWTTPQRRKNLSLEGITDILDYLPQPTLLVDGQAEILAANFQAAEVCAYQRDEIAGTNLTILFPQYLEADSLVEAIRVQPDQFLDITLHPHSQATIPVTLHLREIGAHEKIYLLSFEPIAERQRQQAERQRRSKLMAYLERLMQAINQPDPLEQILVIGSRLLITNAIAVYFCEPDSPIFHKVSSWGNASLLPNEIGPTDLQHFLKPQLWINSQRSILTMVHQAVRVAGFAYLASAPIGTPKAAAGLIVATGAEKPDIETTLPVLQILAEAMTLHIRHNVRIENLETERQTNNQKLAIADTITETIQEGIISVTSDLKIKQLNSAAEYMLGYASQEIYQQPIENVLVGTERLSPAIKLALQGVPTHSLGKTVLHRRDGSSFPALIRITPATPNDNETNPLALIILQDISEHEQAKIRTQQLEQRALLGEVTAIFAHEVRNPINNISTGLQLLALNTTEEQQETQELITRLQQDCTRLTDLMESVLTFSRTGNYKFVSLEVQNVIERLLMRWRPRLTRLNIKFHIQSAPNVLPVMGDQRALEQVFTNLISNAVHAMGENGGTLAIRITLHTAPSGKLFTQIDISDTGPGIPPEIRERIFDPFFTTDPKGTGLGLSITKQIVTAHKGSIHTTSFPGGTVFHLQIPAQEAPKEFI